MSCHRPDKGRNSQWKHNWLVGSKSKIYELGWVGNLKFIFCFFWVQHGSTYNCPLQKYDLGWVGTLKFHEIHEIPWHSRLEKMSCSKSWEPDDSVKCFRLFGSDFRVAMDFTTRSFESPFSGIIGPNKKTNMRIWDGTDRGIIEKRAISCRHLNQNLGPNIIGLSYVSIYRQKKTSVY